MVGVQMFIHSKKQHPHLGATYEILEKHVGGCTVEVKVPGALPATISGLATRADAEQWIERHKQGVAQGVPKRRSFNSRPQS